MERRQGFHLFTGQSGVIGVSAAVIALMGTVVFMVAAPAADAAPSVSGSSLRQSPNLVRVGGSSSATHRSNTEQPAVSGGWSQQNEIQGGGQEGGLGSSVAVSGGTMVVGAPYDNGGTGAAYVYTGTGVHWTQRAELTPSLDGVDGDDFGYAVAIHGGTIVVGAPCHSASANECTGAAYVFTGSGSSWTQQAELDDPGQATDDFFGLTVSNNASRSILVGAYGENGYEGAVFAYTLHGHSWAEKAVIADPASTVYDFFGISIDASGKTLIIGAVGTDGSKGAAYVYSEVNGGWVLKTTLTASNGAGCSTTCGANSPGFIYGDDFGYSVAVHQKTIVVGAAYASYPTAKADGVGSGTAYVFTASGGVWTQKTEVADEPEYAANNDSPADCTFFTMPCNAEDQFGTTVGLLGSTVLSTAPEDYQGYPNSANGAAFVIPKKGGTWPSASPLTKLIASDGMPGDGLGTCLATIGRNVVVVGASGAADYDGAIYFFQD